MPSLFLDAGPLIALANPRDQHHAEAHAILAAIATRTWSTVHTSDHVLAETLNYLRRKVPRLGAAEVVVEHVFGSGDARPVVSTVFTVHGPRFVTALHRFQREFERGLSFTDWTTVVLMEEHGVGELATFDGGFEGLVRTVPRQA